MRASTRSASPAQLPAAAVAVLLEHGVQPAGSRGVREGSQRLPGHHRERPVVVEAQGQREQPDAVLGVRRPRSRGGRRGPPAPSRRPGSRGAPSDMSWCRSERRTSTPELVATGGLSGGRRIADERRQRRGLRQHHPRLHPGQLGAGEPDLAHRDDGPLERPQCRRHGHRARAGARLVPPVPCRHCRTRSTAGPPRRARSTSSARSRSPAMIAARATPTSACIASSIGAQPHQHRHGLLGVTRRRRVVSPLQREVGALGVQGRDLPRRGVLVDQRERPVDVATRRGRPRRRSRPGRTPTAGRPGRSVGRTASPGRASTSVRPFGVVALDEHGVDRAAPRRGRLAEPLQGVHQLAGRRRPRGTRSRS